MYVPILSGLILTINDKIRTQVAAIIIGMSYKSKRTQGTYTGPFS